MFEKKAQSALEYLMTYGWALVVIVIVIAALVFLINPSNVSGPSCVQNRTFPISNHIVSSGSGDINFAVSNAAGQDLTNVSFVLSGTAGGTSVSKTVVRDLWRPSDENILVFDIGGAGAFPKGNYGLTVTLTYKDKDNFARTDSLSCNGSATS